MRSLIRLLGGDPAFSLPFDGAPIAAARTIPEYDSQWWQQLDLAGSMGNRWSYFVSGFARLSDRDLNPALMGRGAFVTYVQGAFSYTLGYCTLKSDCRSRATHSMQIFRSPP